MTRIKRRINASIRTKLAGVFIFSIVLIFAVNLYIYAGINRMMEKVDDSYYSNAQLMDLQSALEGLRSNLKEYLATKSSDSMERYYTSEQEYRDLCGELNDKIYNNDSSIMEKNIRKMSELYLETASMAIDAKRAKNISTYTELYNDSEELYEHIYTYIYSLNATQFTSNSIQYQKLYQSLKYAENASISIFAIVGVLSILTIIMLTNNIIDPLESHLTNARLKYLMAQISPHFLFNTLNAGAQLAMIEGADRTYTYIQNVAAFYRYNIKNDMEHTSLGEEIKMVDNYMYIINVRFANEIQYEKDIDESLMHIEIPMMILQPIIENCVNHGVRNVTYDKKIKLSVSMENDMVCISISDNGIGMSQEKINEIMNSKVDADETDADSNGVGVSNVISRLRLFYNKEDVIEFTSQGENQGTEVAIYIPMPRS